MSGHGLWRAALLIAWMRCACLHPISSLLLLSALCPVFTKSHYAADYSDARARQEMKEQAPASHVRSSEGLKGRDFLSSLPKDEVYRGDSEQQVIAADGFSAHLRTFAQMTSRSAADFEALLRDGQFSLEECLIQLAAEIEIMTDQDFMVLEEWWRLWLPLHAKQLTGVTDLRKSPELRSFIKLLFIDIDHFQESSELFRERVLRLMRCISLCSFDQEAEALILSCIGRVPEVDDRTFEFLRLQKGLSKRDSSRRYVVPDAFSLICSDGIIDTSFFSLPHAYFTLAEMADFALDIRANFPNRRILIMTDVASLEPVVKEKFLRVMDRAEVNVLDTVGRSYSPWPRDPFLPVWNQDHFLHFLIRPNLQSGRKSDSFMAREIIQSLPTKLEKDLGVVTWSFSALPFHGGQFLMTESHVWCSLFSFYERVLEQLGSSSLDAKEMATEEGWGRLAQAVISSKNDYEKYFARKFRFVHPLPPELSEADLLTLPSALIGGSGFDLDSLFTVAQVPDSGKEVAAIGSIAMGIQLIMQSGDEELYGFQRKFKLTCDGDSFKSMLLEHNQLPKASRLEEFLDLLTSEMKRQGVEVVRLPLILVPSASASGRPPIQNQSESFVIGWNNVVLETSGNQLYAEGFGMHWPSGDSLAQELYKKIHIRLRLLHPLVESIVAGGGYRCASFHVVKKQHENASHERE